MKNALRRLSFIILFFATLMIGGCGGDDDPSPTDLLIGMWKEIEIDGTKTTDYDLILTFKRNGDYSQQFVSGTFNDSDQGEWEWNADQDKIIIIYDGDQNESLLLIVNELTANLLEIEVSDSNIIFEKQ